MNHCFIVTSAINTKFGVFSADQRLTQTLGTIASIKDRIPDAKIIIMECAGEPLTPAQHTALASQVNFVIDYTEDRNVIDIYNSTSNWDIVKNSTEIMCFGNTVRHAVANNWFEGVDRVHKLSGRYLLSDHFDKSVYEQPEVRDKVVISPKRQSQFPVTVTDQPWQYMSRLWSWPIGLTNQVVNVYDHALSYFADRVSKGGYTDIEHALARFLDPAIVHEQAMIGVKGEISPTGAKVSD